MKNSFMKLFVGLIFTALVELLVEMGESYLERRKEKREKRRVLEEYKQTKLAEIRERRRQMGINN